MKSNASPACIATGILQRQCACGTHTTAGGDCASCEKEKSTNKLQRAAVNSEKINQVPPIVHEVLRSPGQPLDAHTRSFFEPLFGHDFSRVRVHKDAKAGESARAVNALAYTVGRDVVFDAGQFAPEMSAGRKLLAHELTHVVQQRGSARALHRQAASPSKPAPRPDPVPGLGPTRAQEVEALIKASNYQDAIDKLVHYKYMDYEIDLKLLANQGMTYDPNLTSVDGSTLMGSWDYLSTPEKAEPAKVRIGPGAFSSVSYLYSVIMHEYQHVLWQQTLAHQKESQLLHSQRFVTPDEVQASAWEILHASESGLAKMPDRIARIWKNLNESFWQLDAKSQASERPLVNRAFQKAKELVKGSQVTLVPFSSSSSVNP